MTNGCGKTAKFRPELICGKTRVAWNPITCEGNYIWLCEMTLELCKEYTYRYGKVHKCEQIGLVEALSIPPLKSPMKPFFDPTPAMPDEYKVPGNSIVSYRNYYVGDKQRMAKWKNRSKPDWYTLAA